MRLVWGLLLVGLLAGLVLVLAVAGGGLGVVELTLWLALVAVGLGVVAWREARRGRRARPL
jgi:hypothetical protein